MVLLYCFSFLGISDLLTLQYTDTNPQIPDDIPDLEGYEKDASCTETGTKTTNTVSCDTADLTESTQETFQDEGATALPSLKSDIVQQASVDLISLVQYSLEQDMREFMKAVHECCICFCSKTGEHFVRLNQCRHNFCKDCLTTYCTEHVREGTVDSLMLVYLQNFIQ